MSTRLKILHVALFAGFMLVGAAALPAQEPSKGKDDDLDSFLKKIDKSAKPVPPVKPQTGPKKDGEPSRGSVSDKDKDIDKFLEKLGVTPETPAPEDKPSGPGGPGDKPDPGDSGEGKEKQKPDELKGRDKQTDEHLEELTGRRRKPKNQKQGDGNGPLSDVIKEMRDVEERLGKPDTGEETRKKQTQIVKQLDQVIQQLRRSGSSGKRKLALVRQAGQKGNQQLPLNENPGNTGGNAPFTKPEKPTSKRSMAGSKDEWGHLPPGLREEMDNVFKEEGLPSREDLIRRYYLSLSKKSLAREE